MAQGLRLVLFGPPGAGKGTQAQLLRDRLKVAHISSGDLFRYHLGEGTALGLRAKEYINKGELVPDYVTLEMILDKVMSFSDDEGFILDGFPRTPHQGTAINGPTRRMGWKPFGPLIGMGRPETAHFTGWDATKCQPGA